MYHISSGAPLPVAVSASTATLVTRPFELFEDPVGKQRVSSAQSLIDTDFELSLQPGKWQTENLVQNRSSFFAKGTGGNSFDLSSATITGGNQAPYSTITVALTAHGLSVNDIITVQETTNQYANGTFIVLSVTDANTFTYLARGQATGSLMDSTQTLMYGGGTYTNATIAMTSVSSSGATPSVITVTTTEAHGLIPGTPIIINGTTNPATGSVNGRWVITTVATPNTFVFTASGLVTAGNVTLGTGILMVSPDAYVQHRATDGGVSITTSGNFAGPQMIRQTRRYFRYQSGKGICFTTGYKMTPTYDIDTVAAVGATATVVTQQPHNMQVGATIKVEGVEVASGTNTYTGTFTVATIVSVKSFTYTMAATPADLAPSGVNAYVSCIGWTTANARSGLFDDQNGFYFEYDGSTLFAVRRDSIKELSGKVSCTVGSTTVTQTTGSTTKFRSQLVVGDFIVIKGHSYMVTLITSDTSMSVSPAYRGSTNITNSRVNKTQNTKIPQSAWNLDKCDGTGTSGYNIDVSRMQMATIDYSWYGAGTIRWGIRGVNGAITYCHRLPMNNVNYAAYMRSGNLPGRFEVNNFGYTSRLVANAAGTRGGALGSTDATLYVENAAYWPTAGYVVIADASFSELARYTGIGAYNSTAKGYPLTGLTRRTTYSLAGIAANGSFSTTAYTMAGYGTAYTFNPDTTVGGVGSSQCSVQCVANTCAPLVSHWGVSVTMDGGFDDDRAVVFVASMLRNLTVLAGVQRPLLAIRIAPSVDSGNGQNFGVRELVNRMQLTLRNIGVSTQGQFLVEGILNPSSISGVTLPANWTSVKVGSGSLAQVVYFDSTQTYNAVAATASGSLVGGDRIFAFYTENSGGTNFSVTSVELNNVRDLGTSILSGDGTAAAPSFPNGPDVLVITARNIEASGSKNIACRLSWTEAQA